MTLIEAMKVVENMKVVGKMVEGMRHVETMLIGNYIGSML